MTRLIALGTLSLVVALSLVVVPLASAQVFDNGTNLGQSDNQTTASPTVSPTVSPTTGETVSDDVSATGTTSPGLPDTGFGGNAAINFSILLASGLIVLGGVALLARRTA